MPEICPTKAVQRYAQLLTQQSDRPASGSVQGLPLSLSRQRRRWRVRRARVCCSSLLRPSSAPLSVVTLQPNYGMGKHQALMSAGTSTGGNQTVLAHDMRRELAPAYTRYAVERLRHAPRFSGWALESTVVSVRMGASAVSSAVKLGRTGGERWRHRGWCPTLP